MENTTTNTGVGRRGLELSEALLFERSAPGRRGVDLPRCDLADDALAAALGTEARATPAPLPEIAEPEAMRHYTRLSQMNYAIDLGSYPLGSCTMKYNPKINEWAARQPGFAALHPYLPESRLQGALSIMFDLQNWLSEIGGFHETTLQPAAGAHGELLGVMMIRAALEARGENRTKIIVPESAHGTNPATAAFNGFKVVSVKAREDGFILPEDVAAVMDEDVAGIMITNPNTLGIFEPHIRAICDIVHDKGGYVYGDGANMNAILGVARPGDLGIDVMHYNLHKTFTTPHGGGGPGCGAVGAAKSLSAHLPVPMVKKNADGTFGFDHDRPLSVGRIRSFYGNFGMMVRAWTYMRELGAQGLREVAERAVLNANYVRARLEDRFHLPFAAESLHEVVFTDKKQNEAGVTTMDMAKRLIDFGIHPPTVYFPLVVHGALMIEPTETESKSDLDAMVDAFIAVTEEAARDPEHVKAAPHHTHHRRLDEATAARFPVLRWQPDMPRTGDGFAEWAKANARKR